MVPPTHHSSCIRNINNREIFHCEDIQMTQSCSSNMHNTLYLIHVDLSIYDVIFFDLGSRRDSLSNSSYDIAELEPELMRRRRDRPRLGLTSLRGRRLSLKSRLCPVRSRSIPVRSVSGPLPVRSTNARQTPGAVYVTAQKQRNHATDNVCFLIWTFDFDDCECWLGGLCQKTYFLFVHSCYTERPGRSRTPRP